MSTYTADQIIVCPHCDSMQDDVAEDFVIVGQEKDKALHECYDCGDYFTVHQDGDNFIVEKE